ncbi:helix-turn-helix domain-containing protein, partial [bacterium]|nr:helix-turn-helix domain-containing protein [bacterium]
MTDTSTRDQIFVGKLIDIIHANIGNESFGVNELANESGMSLYTLGRRIHSINRKTVNQFIREIRLQKAMELLNNEEYTVSEVAYRTGFGSPAYFNKCFHEHFGYSPGRIKKGDVDGHEPGILTGGNGKGKRAGNFRQSKMLSFAGTLFLLMVIATFAFFTYTRVKEAGQNSDTGSADGRISVAVMPFNNLTNDTLWNIWQNGIQINLITSLSNSEELKISQTETVNNLLKAKGYTSYMSITPSVAGSISRMLNADMFVNGIINKAGNTIRLNAQLIKTGTGESLRSYQIDGQPDEILQVIDSLSGMIYNSLIISKLENERPDALPNRHYIPTDSPEAYRYFIMGQAAFYKNDFQASIQYYLK